MLVGASIPAAGIRLSDSLASSLNIPRKFAFQIHLWVPTRTCPRIRCGNSPFELAVRFPRISLLELLVGLPFETAVKLPKVALYICCSNLHPEVDDMVSETLLLNLPLEFVLRFFQPFNLPVGLPNQPSDLSFGFAYRFCQTCF